MQYVNLCESCIHYEGKRKCAAFDLIPHEVWFDNNRHNKKIKGQRGDYLFKFKE